ncbi:39499_t:CDS:2 [Gigaspora margarita]|uniref:39499_t:CDS:1 n=1 Tax=Gigaspora margarita TaxID=4874 RepID=A0ABM8VWE4_GIGMA|nr:39499_t:CDS:2 [Gigaspora margarita]
MTQKKVKVISDMPTELIKYKMIGEKLLPKKLLIRLYDIEKHSLGSIENNQNIKNYAILSYVREVYYKDDYNNEENKLFMNLYDSLDIIKTREKNNALDAIYSVLEALLNVAKTAVKNGYLEPLVWHGEGDRISVECGECRENKNLCGKSGECKNIENVKFDEKNNLIDLVKIKGIKHSIIEIGAEPTRLEDELTNKHHFTRIVKLVDNKAKIRLVGTLETLKKIRAGDILLVPNKKE